MPKRGVAAVIITGLALILVLNFKTPTVAPATTGFANPAFASPSPSAPGGVAAGSSASAGPGGTGGASPGTAAPSATATPGGTAASGYKSGTFTGTTVQLPFGPVQVSATIASGRIKSIQPRQYPNDNVTSLSISQYAIPTLIQETLQAQSAQVSLVSGATYTSAAYQQSLQSALDQARA